jgi:hypothetical protein
MFYAMKKFSLLFLLFIVFVFHSNAQQSSSNSTSLKNWIVDLSHARSSFDGIKIDKIELNDNNTVVHMSFHNLGFASTYVEACNTFHILSKGKKVARFIKAENIPTRKMDGITFNCADELNAMRIKPGQFVRFRLFFTRMPATVNFVDVIEYDGNQSCEFDVFDLNLTHKEPLLNPTVAAVMPKQMNKTPEKINQKPTKKVEKNQKPPLIASKSVPEPPVVNEVEKKPLPELPKVTPPEKRNLKLVKDFVIAPKTVTIDIWDNDIEDGDRVSVMFNDRWILKDYAVTKNKKKVEITLSPGVNKLVFHADNLGKMPPNTATLSFYDGKELQTISLKSDMDNSQGIHLIKN